MKKRYRFLLAILAMQVHGSIIGVPKKNVLMKAVHHAGSPRGLELGHIALCFARQPAYQKLSSKRKGDMHHERFLFPDVQASADIIGAFNKKAYKRGYQAKLKLVNNGIELDISYDESTVSRNLSNSPQPFTCIDTQKGLCFSFYNKTLLQKINNAEGKILRTAHTPKRPKIVIDPGHGGTDSGAKSCFNDLEKDIALNVGLQLASLLKDASYDVILTRDSDKTVALDERTTCANIHNADLFISLHANAGRPSASGIETFYLDDALYHYKGKGNDRVYAKAVHAFRDAITKQSTYLAQCLHSTTLAHIKRRYAQVTNRNVKNAVAQVLMGTMMPSALIELGFLSNQEEAALLHDKQYQLLLAYGIRDGVMAYLRAL